MFLAKYLPHLLDPDGKPVPFSADTDGSVFAISYPDNIIDGYDGTIFDSSPNNPSSLTFSGVAGSRIVVTYAYGGGTNRSSTNNGLVTLNGSTTGETWAAHFACGNFSGRAGNWVRYSGQPIFFEIGESVTINLYGATSFWISFGFGGYVQ